MASSSPAVRRVAGRRPPDEGEPPDAREAPSSGPSAQRPLTILIVDDVRDTRELYQRYFEFCGARAVMAADGVEALQSVLFERPDAILLDLAMPKMTGFDVLRSLKMNPRTQDIPVIVVSGQRALDAALDAGADAYVEKPCLPKDLMERVLRVLRDPAAGTAPTRAAARGHAHLLEGLRILLVDDHAEPVELLARVLSTAGAHVDVVRTVQEAIDAVQGDPPAVLVSDLAAFDASNRMMRHIRALSRGAGFPAVVISALPWEENREAAILAGFDEWLSRPAINTIVDAVARLTGRA